MNCLSDLIRTVEVPRLLTALALGAALKLVGDRLAAGRRSAGAGANLSPRRGWSLLAHRARRCAARRLLFLARAGCCGWCWPSMPSCCCWPLADLLTLPRRKMLRRRAPRRAASPRCEKSHPRDADASLNHSRRELIDRQVRDGVPRELRSRSRPNSRCRSPAAAARRCDYVLRPSRRGAFAIDQPVRQRQQPAGASGSGCSIIRGRDGDQRLSRHEATRRNMPCWPAPIA